MTTVANKPATEKKYTEAQEKRIQEVADANGGNITNDLAESLADEFDKDVRSVRAKASRMGIYKAQERKSANGGAVESKLDIAEEIAGIIGKNMDGLEKAPKSQLTFIRDFIKAA